MSEHYKTIGDIDELRWFYDNILPPLNRGEVYGLSLSARKKCLKEEERAVCGFSHNEMFEKRVIRERSWETFLKNIYRTEVHKQSYLSGKGIPFPDRAIRVYFNINPVSCLKAYKEVQSTLAGGLINTLSTCVNTSGDIHESTVDFLTRLDSISLSAYLKQGNVGTKHWVDFDVDYEVASDMCYSSMDFYLYVYETARMMLLDILPCGSFAIVTSPSGFHVLVKKKALRFNPNEIINKLQEGLMKIQVLKVNECVKNNNNMIILPGTIAYNARGSEDDFYPYGLNGKPVVYVYNKGDFNNEK